MIGDPITEDDQVVHLLASLPEASANVPEMVVVTESFLNEERKMKNKDDRE